MVFFKDFTCQVKVVDGAGATCVMHNDGLAKAGGFAQSCVTVDDGIEHHVLEMHFHFFDDLLRKTQASVEHGEKDAFDVKVRVETRLHDFDGIEQLA